MRAMTLSIVPADFLKPFSARYFVREYLEKLRDRNASTLAHFR